MNASISGSHTALASPSPSVYHPTLLDLQENHQRMVMAFNSMPQAPTLRSQPAHAASAHTTPSRPRKALGEASTSLLNSASSASERMSPSTKTAGADGLLFGKQKALQLDTRKASRTSKSLAPLKNAHLRGNLKEVVTQDLMPYYHYRARKRKDVTQGDIWEEDVEQAFMEDIPKIGRRKLSMPHLEGKLRGRNELISDYILRKTGKYRSRKQVSSHIQVLKNLLKHNKEFMALITAKEPNAINDYDFDSPPEPTPILSARIKYEEADAQDVFASPPPSATTPHFPGPVYGAPALQPAQFIMWVGTSNAAGQIEGCVHTYTTLAPYGAAQQPAAPLSAVAGWATRFPHVADIAGELAGVQLLHVSASVSMLAAATPANSLLCTLLEVAVPAGVPRYADAAWECVTRIYAPGQKVWELSHAVPVTSGEGGGARLTLPFASDFWSYFYTGLATAHGRRRAAPDDRRQREREVRGAIRAITVVQELRCAGAREALLLWDFAQAAATAKGSATWRELLPPLAPLPADVLAPDAGLRIDTLGAAAAAAAPDWSALPLSPYDALSPETLAQYFPLDELEGFGGQAFDAAGDAGVHVLDSLDVPYYPQADAGGYADFAAAASMPTPTLSNEAIQYLQTELPHDMAAGTETWQQTYSPISPIDAELDVRF